ncbi:MAG: hypothetical protein IKZ38_00130 [Clostridia bacterium]|nr:hypothetical protein [Clostridia bacterium]
MLIDVHSHVLPMVDDGSQSVNDSLEMVKKAISQGVSHLVLTPHYRGVFNLCANELNEAFDKFNEQVKRNYPQINLYLGQEIHADGEIKRMVLNGELLTVNGNKHLLLEFKYNEECDIVEYIYEFKRLGYKPIVAHVERYSYLTDDDIAEIKSVGGLIQINAESLLGKSDFCSKRKAVKLIKQGLIDVVAGDFHSQRPYLMADAYKFVSKKFGEDIAKKLFIENGLKIINGNN